MKSQVEFLIRINQLWVQVQKYLDRQKSNDPERSISIATCFYHCGHRSSIDHCRFGLKLEDFNFIVFGHIQYDIWTQLLKNWFKCHNLWLIDLQKPFKDDQFDFNFFSMLIEGGFHFVPLCRFIDSIKLGASFRWSFCPNSTWGRRRPSGRRTPL